VFETIDFLSTITMAGIFTLLVVMNRRAAHEEEQERSGFAEAPADKR
jgi:hypothetical protein